MTRSAVLWSLAGVLLLAGCPRHEAATDAGVPDAGPVRLGEKEPNDLADQAQVLTGSTLVDASLSFHDKRADVDLYRIAPPAPGTLSLTVSGIPGAKVALELLDVSGNRMARTVAQADGEGVRMDRIGVRGPLLAKVSSTTQGAGGGYTLSAIISPPEQGFESEPNDRAADATPLMEGPDGWKIKGTLGTPGDEDWYRVGLTGPAAEDGGVTEDAGTGEDGGLGSAAQGEPGEAARLDAGDASALRDGGEAAPAGAAGEAATVGGAGEAASAGGAGDTSAAAGAGEAAPAGGAGATSTAGGTGQTSASSSPPGAVGAAGGASGATGQDAGQGLADGGQATIPELEPPILAMPTSPSGMGLGQPPSGAGAIPQDTGAMGVPSQPADAGLAQARLPDGGLLPTAEALPPPEPRIPLRIEISAVPGVKLEVEVLTEAEASLFHAVGEEGQPLLLRNVGVRASDPSVYLVVRSAWVGTGKDAKRPANPDVPYAVTVRRETEADNSEIEPNDSPATATPLPATGFKEGFLSPAGDVDLYAVRCPAPTLLDLTLSGLERADLELSVLRPREDGGTPEEVLRANDGEVKEPERLNAVACDGEVDVQVRSAAHKVNGKWLRDDSNPDTRYRLSAQARPDTGADEREPNGSPEEATPISLGQAIRGTIQPTRDVDDYRLDLSNRPVKTALRATVTPILKVRIGLYLYRLEDGKKPVLVQTSDRGHGERPQLIRYSAEPGVYLLQVRDVRNRESNFQDAYQLTVEQAQ